MSVYSIYDIGVSDQELWSIFHKTGVSPFHNLSDFWKPLYLGNLCTDSVLRSTTQQHLYDNFSSLVLSK